MFSPTLIVDLGDSERRDLLGGALFFGSSFGIVAGCLGPVLRGAVRDLERLRGVLPLSDSDFALVRNCLTRTTPGTVLAMFVSGILLGLAHNYLLSHFSLPAPFVFTQCTGTVLLWIIMNQAMPKLIINALLFSRLGAGANPDLLRPSKHSAFGDAAIRPGILVIGVIVAYGFLIMGEDNPFDDAVWIGIAASLLSLVGIVALPLRGIRRRIRETRTAALQQLDARYDAISRDGLTSAEPQQLSAMDTLLDMRERVAQAPGWPMDLAGVRRILLYVVLPPLTWAAAALVEMLIDSAV